mmetsp:Transcript_15318/g.34944  ORF Transcript_15318/g.34944 Transcript_15318/m.34944 type:complete len:209 (+) Transcript_15318:946-1572(+)
MSGSLSSSSSISRSSSDTPAGNRVPTASICLSGLDHKLPNQPRQVSDSVTVAKWLDSPQESSLLRLELVADVAFVAVVKAGPESARLIAMRSCQFCRVHWIFGAVMCKSTSKPRQSTNRRPPCRVAAQYGDKPQMIMLSSDGHSTLASVGNSAPERCNCATKSPASLKLTVCHMGWPGAASRGETANSLDTKPQAEPIQAPNSVCLPP